MKQHVTVVAALQIGFGILKVLIAAVVFLIMLAGGLISGDAEALGDFEALRSLGRMSGVTGLPSASASSDARARIQR